MEATCTTVRIVFEKTGPARWIGHLDVMRAFERAFRRASISIVLTQGHNPRPRLRFVFPASVGLVCRADIVFADVESDPAEITPERLNGSLPPGLMARAVEPVSPADRKSALAAYEFAEYRIALTLHDEVSFDEMCAVARRVLDRDRITVARSGSAGDRDVDIRPFIADLRAERSQPAGAVFTALAHFGSEGTVKHSELGQILRAEVGHAEIGMIERTGLLSSAEATAARSAPT